MPILARATAILSILLLALFVAGCGGSDDESSTAEVAPTTEAGGGAPDADNGIHLGKTIKLHVVAIETCAANNIDGSYTGCLDLATLREYEPAIAEAVGTTTVEPADDPTQSYEVSTTLDDATFTETHSADGTIAKTCEPAEAPGCSDGKW